MSDFKSYADWKVWRDRRNADKASDHIVRWVKGPNPPKIQNDGRRNRVGSSGHGHGFRPAGSKLADKAHRGKVGARTVGVVSVALENISRSKRAA
jgi:hypothetical protein